MLAQALPTPARAEDSSSEVHSPDGWLKLFALSSPLDDTPCICFIRHASVAVLPSEVSENSGQFDKGRDLCDRSSSLKVLTGVGVKTPFVGIDAPHS